MLFAFRSARPGAVAVTVAAALLGAGPGAPAAAAPATAPPQQARAYTELTAPRVPPAPEVDPESVLVRFRPGADARARAAAVRGAGGIAQRPVRGTSWTKVATAAPAQGLRALRRDPAVEAAAPNYRRRATAVPDDALFSKGRQGWMTTLRLPAAWDRAQATSAQVVAVLDTGVDADHPDLLGRVLPGRDVVNGDADATDDEGHGTAVASVVAARAGDGIGIAGVAGEATVLPVKVLDGLGSGDDAGIAEGITWAADQGADVINLSLGGPGASAVLDEAVAHARAKGSVVVAAAGNFGIPLPSYPAASPGALAVGATDWSGTLAAHSSTGSFVDLVAPGHRMRSARPAADGLGGWRDVDGTSFSSPVVAGVALLVLAQNPSWTPTQVEQRLLSTAHDAGPEGVDTSYGRGLVDPVAALGGTPLPAVAAPPGDGDDTMSTARLFPGGAVTTMLGDLHREGEADWYAVDVAGTTDASLSLQSEHGVGPSNEEGRAQTTDAVIDVFAPDRGFVGRIDSSGPEGVESAYLGLWAPGRWWFRVSSYLSSRSYDSYRFSVGTLGQPTGPAPRFTPPLGTPVPARAAAAAVADVTGDGRPETLVTTTATGDADEYQLHVHEVDAEGQPNELQSLDTGARTQFTSDGGPTSSTAMGLATGDLTGDGRIDAAVAAGRWLAVFPQREGRLGAAVPVPGSQGAQLVEAGDVDGDGALDLVAVIANASPPRVDVFLRRGTGWEQRAVTTRGASDIALGDVNGDRRLDVVGVSSASIVLSRQRADGTFADEVLSAGTGEGVEVADVTGDGRADVITTSEQKGDFQSTLDVRAQTSGGLIAAPASEPIFYAGRAIRAGDVDGDGRRDVVVAQDGSYDAGIFLGRTDGTLAPEQRVPLMRFTSAYLVGGLALGDVTRDGALDLVLADHNQGLVRVARRSADFPRRPWLVDTSPTEGAAGVSSSVTPVVRFGRALDPSALAVRLEDAAGRAVTTTASYDATTRALTVRPSTALAAGRWALRLDGVRDALGSRAPEHLALRFTVGTAATLDTVAPDTSLRIGPTGTTPVQSSPRFSYDATEPAAGFQCSLDGAPYTFCPSDRIYRQDLAEGTHTFRVRAVDAAGRVDGSPATRTWTISPRLTPPANDSFDTPQVLTGPSGTVRGSSVGAQTDRLPGFLPLTQDDQGGHSVWYRWTAPATGTVVWDTAGSDFDTIMGVFSGEPTAETLRRRGEDDDVGPGTRTSRVRLPVREGETLRIGVAGTGDPIYAPSGAVALAWSHAPAADTSPPETTITGGPGEVDTTGRATFTFASSEAGSRFECHIDDGGWRGCTSPITYYHYVGDHTLRVRAIDAAGNVDPTPATRSWRTDTIPPTTRFTSQPPASTSETAASFSFVADEAATFECRLDRGTWSPCTSPHTRRGLEPGPHELDVRATDAAGNLETRPVRAPWVVTSSTASCESGFSDVSPEHPFCADISWMRSEGISTGTRLPDGTAEYRPLLAVSRQAMGAFLYRSQGSPAFTAPAEASFADVPRGHAFFAEIEWMKARGISGGTPQESGKPLYKPDDAVSRQAMAPFLYRAAGSPGFTAPAEATFADVDAAHPFFREIEWMAATGISRGTAQAEGKPLYRPRDAASRQAMAAFLRRAVARG